MSSLMDKYTNEEFKQIVFESSSYKDCLLNLGYHANSGPLTSRLKKKIEDLEIDVSHFNSNIPVIRSEDNIFIKDSSADQKVLRRWYQKGNYTEYKCAICGQQPFWNGKDLIMILDHINGYNHDNRLENLRWVCPNCNYQLDTTNGKNINHGIHTINTCIDCGKQISKKSTRCKECNVKNRTSQEVSCITREELKNLIRTTPFTTIGKKYQVSDNAVRKWCEKYSLPKKVSIIKSYTDEEWLKI